MSFGGGKEREWLKPLTPEGHLDTDEPDLDSMIGCHTGVFQGLNVLNPQPGFEYVWERNRGPELAKARMRGGQMVGADDPERAAMDKLMSSHGRTSMDSSDVYGDVVLFKYPESAMRAIREREGAKAQAMMRGGAAEYADRASEIERQMSRGMPSRFKRGDHALRTMDSNENVVDHWTPDDGIIRES